MSTTFKTALLLLDCQTGVADAAYAKSAMAQAAKALEAARKAGMPVFFSKVGFRLGYPEVADWNPVFVEAKQKGLMEIGSSEILLELAPNGNEPTVIKSRINPFMQTDLSRMLRAAQVEELVLAGVSTSGVILSAFCTTADEDYQLKILSDACADPKQALHDAFMQDLFPRSATVLTADQWIQSIR